MRSTASNRAVIKPGRDRRAYHALKETLSARDSKSKRSAHDGKTVGVQAREVNGSPRERRSDAQGWSTMSSGAVEERVTFSLSAAVFIVVP